MNEERVFYCKICNKSYSNSNSLGNHRRKFHKTNVVPNKYTCQNKITYNNQILTQLREELTEELRQEIKIINSHNTTNNTNNTTNNTKPTNVIIHNNPIENNTEATNVIIHNNPIENNTEATNIIIHNNSSSTNELTLYNDDKLIRLIKDNFNDTDNQLFKMSFELFSTTQTKPDDFIINFDDIYEWIGFSRKDPAKRLLEKSFKKEYDYKLDESNFPPKGGKLHVGRPSNDILLTIDCFKEFCLLAATAQSKRIYKYYIKMEKIIFKYIQEQYQEQINLIHQKDKQLALKDKEINHLINQKYEEHAKVGSIYIFSTDKPDYFKCGRTNSTIKRKAALQTAQVEDIQLLYEYKTSNDVLLESIVHDILINYRSKSNREHFWCKLDYMKNIIDIAGNVLDILKSTFQHITTKEILDKINEKLSNIQHDAKHRVDSFPSYAREGIQ